MKLEHVRPGQYEGRLEPYAVSLSRDYLTIGWTGTLTYADQKHQVEHKVKRRVEQMLVVTWIRLRLALFYEKVPPDNLFSRLWNHSWDAVYGDDLSPLALRDYLEERGLTYISDIVRDGQAAGVVWPGGWARLGG